MSEPFAVVMAGGSGTRFWPRSRRHAPKQLLPIGSAAPLIVRTSRRVAPLVPPERQLVITSADTVDAVRALLPEIPPGHVVGEPVGRDTAPCIGLAAHLVATIDADAPVLAMPSDHVIEPEDGFRASLAAGLDALVARDAPVVVFGVRPDRPTSAYGYLRPGARLADGLFALAAFEEKPAPERAATLVHEGCLWNAGLFAFRPSRLAAAYDAHLPGMNVSLAKIAAAWGGGGFDAALSEHFPDLQAISIDFGVMEKLTGGLLVPLDVRWDDVGSWTALARLLGKDGDDNVVEGDAVALSARGNILSATDGVVAVRGVDELIVVHTPDATLVCRRDDAEGVKAVVAELAARGMDAYL